MKEYNAQKFTAVDMALLPSSTHNVKLKLMMLGWVSVGAWARENGHTPHQVIQTLARWLGREDGKMPYGEITIQVLHDLMQTIKLNKRPKKAYK